MKTNMKLKSTLWALAFACAAVSCSDDLEENGGGITPDNGQNAETAKINVAINTEVTTKADTPTPGEDGEGADKSEVGDETEYIVKDVTLILYEQSTSVTSATWDIKSDCKLVAAGWTDEIGVMENSDVTTPGDGGFPNGKMTTVEVAVKDGQTSLVGDQATTYGVIAVTNLGETDGSDLVDKIASTSGYNTVADLDKELFQNRKNGHVMSTHSITGTAGDSQVTFTPNSDAIPAVSVYVERLSAKIRLSESQQHQGFKYEVDATMVETDGSATQAAKDEIVLNSVAVVNQLTSGSFLLKRVSTELTNGETDLSTADNADDSDVIIGDEKVSTTSGDATNFVIDPWTRSKKKPWSATLPSYTGATNVPLAYTNQFTESTYGELWNGYSSPSNNQKVAINTSNLDAQKDLFLCYTQENTTSKDASLNGYTTGALFKATYYPAQRMELVTDDGTDKGSVKAEKVTYDADSKNSVDFYTYSVNGKEMIFKDYDAILAYIIAKAKVEDDSKASITYYNFVKKDGNFDTNFGKNIAKLRDYANEDPFGYIAKMVAEYDKTQTDPTGTATYQAIDEYLNEATEVTDDENTADIDEAAEFNKRVKPYEKGVCYYPYWIKHANNGIDQGTGSVGVMEFGIVRNNIYDMEVSGISGLGYSEVDVTDPNNPDEDNSLKIQVNLYVKNWVVRSNSGIIL